MHPSFTVSVVGALIFLLQGAGPVEGQRQPSLDPEPVGITQTEERVSTAVRPGIRQGEIRIDGHIDEAAWRASPTISSFVQSEPVEEAPAEHDTHVWVLVDEQAIYVAARLWDDPSTVTRVLNRRDEGGPFFDWFGLSLDPGLTRRNGYGFRVNASGVQQDQYLYDDIQQDRAWNAVWESAVQHDSLGWTVEIRIPLSQLRFTSTGEPQTWGFNVHRRRVASAELTHLALQLRRAGVGIPGFSVVSQFGTLEDVIFPPAIRRIEARPYLLSSLDAGPAEPGNPFFDGRATRTRVGSDFRVGLGTSFTLDATANPDFGQVEADPAVINLTAFESFFDEQRPFFVEDSQVFDFRFSGPQNQLFYSRRIGRTPRGRPPGDATFGEVPQETTILGAGKLTGRTTNGLAFGALAAVTRAERGRYFSEDGEILGFPAEPSTGYGVLSVQQNLNQGMTQVTGIATTLHRRLPSGTVFLLPDQAQSLGVKFDHQWGNRIWRLTGFLAGSHVRGTPEAMVALQRASNHFFQRPDATRGSVDSTATSLSGAEWRLQLERQNTEWIGSVWLAEVTRGFEVNDIGFSGSRERLDAGVRAGYRQLQPGRHLRNWELVFNTFQNFSHEALDAPGSVDSWRRAHTNGNLTLTTRLTLLNYHGGEVEVGRVPGLHDRARTRGGPTMFVPARSRVRVGINSDRRRAYAVNADVEFSSGEEDSSEELSVSASLDMRPAPQLQLQLRPRFTKQSDGSQYVLQTPVLPFEPTFGRRYFFGELDQQTLSLQTRVSYAFTPSLSLQVYTQPLLSSGDYVRYKQLAEGSTYRFVSFQEGTAVETPGAITCEGGSICKDGSGTQYVDLNGDGQIDYTFADRDFNLRTLIGNAVLRWEYRPGSTVFFVWQRQHDAAAAEGDFRLGRDLSALWSARAHNRFIVKANYWLGL